MLDGGKVGVLVVVLVVEVREAILVELVADCRELAVDDEVVDVVLVEILVVGLSVLVVVVVAG